MNSRVEELKPAALDADNGPVYCPVCNIVQTHFALRVKDHSVSQEYFDIWECSQCSFRFTKNPPPQDQIGRYYQSEDYISHSNTKAGMVNSLYHRVRNHTLSTKRKLIESATGHTSGKHLDIGAGTGAFVKFMNEAGWQSAGIEPDAKARDQALIHHQTVLLPAENFEMLPAGSYDAITLWHVLEHVHDLYPYLRQIHQMLKPEGVLFIAVPNYTSYDAKKYQENWAAYDVPRHLYHFSPASMQWLLRTAEFNLIQEEPMWWDSFYISLLSEKYAYGKSSLLNGFVTGTASNLGALKNKEACSSLIYVSKKS